MVEPSLKDINEKTKNDIYFRNGDVDAIKKCLIKRKIKHCEKCIRFNEDCETLARFIKYATTYDY